MTLPRKAYRDAVRTALAADGDLSGVTPCRAWALPKNEEDLPAFTVVTRDERVEMETGTSANRTVELAVVLKCAGGDEIEDTLDDYAEAIERVVIGVLSAWDPELPFYQASRVITQVEGGSKKRIGTLETHFAITRYADEGAQS
jgi:hypothetical protein